MNQSALDFAIHQATLKVNRAYRHFQEAQEIAQTYIETDFCRLTIEADAQTGHPVIRVTSDPVPPAMALAIGDAFHCFSAALDYLASGLMRAAGSQSKRTTFPSHESRQALRKTFMPPATGKDAPANRRIVTRLPHFACVLLTKIKPYRGGDFYVWEIRKADNIDKHNLIIPTVSVTKLAGIHVEDVQNKNTVRGLNVTIGAGQTFTPVGFSATSKLEIRDKGKPAASIIFPQSSEIFPGEPVFPTLLQCGQSVSQIVDIVRTTRWG